MPFIILLLYTLLTLISPTTISSLEHIVLFMQENRSFDHYYGTLKGVRGFNDRSSPPLPSGKPPFYQPTGVTPPKHNAMCGCIGCNLIWSTTGDNELQQLFSQMDCDQFIGLLQGANPPILLTKGQLCQKLIEKLLKSTIQHMQVDSQLSSLSSCPLDLVVNIDITKENNTQKTTLNNYMLPFHLAFNETSATCMPAPEMNYPCDLKIWNNGRMDAWNTARAPGFGMSYFKREDLPFYYSLADAFTIGDQYFQSTFTPTNPNRLHQFSGSNGLSVNGTVILDDSEPDTGINWETLGETLEKAGVSWKLYQEEDNFDDNAFQWFEAFKTAQPGSALYEKGLKKVPTGQLVQEFYNDVSNKTVPSVSIIIAPTWLSEHATNHPQDGEDLTARLLKVLEENQEIYQKEFEEIREKVLIGGEILQKEFLSMGLKIKKKEKEATMRNYKGLLEILQGFGFEKMDIKEPNFIYFGSFKSGFALKASDIDTTILTNTAFNERDLLTPLLYYLKEYKVRINSEIKDKSKLLTYELEDRAKLNIRIPIIKFIDKERDFKADIAVNNVLGVANSTLLKVFLVFYKVFLIFIIGLFKDRPSL